MEYDFDLFVIGAGSGGVRASRMAASYGARVGVAESTYLGGTCVNVGCVPKKLFVYGSHYSQDMQDAAGFGWNVGPSQFHWPTLRDNKTKEIQRLNGIYREMIENAGVALYQSHCRFIDDHRLQVGEKVVSADKILIATGGWPYVPEFPGRELAITSNEAFYLEDFPSSVAVVGGGYIAVEFAGIFAGLGAETQLLYRGDLFLRGFDQGVREFVRDELLHKNIDLKFNTDVASITEVDGKKRVTSASGVQTDVDLVLYATGRRANTGELGLQNTGVTLNTNGSVVVDENFQTNADNIYAIGDVIDRVQLTPVAIAEGMCIANNLFTENPKRQVNYENIATAVFCQPNIGTVGPTEEAAAQKYTQLQVYESRFRPMKNTLTGDPERTLMKLLVDGASDKVVGVHMVGPDAGEIIQGLSVAINAGATKAQFDATVGIHPTAAEEFVTMREVRS